MLIKIIATGIWNHPKSFLRSHWSYFDIYIIFVGFLCSLPVCKDIEVLQVLNMFRVLKLTYAITPMRQLMNPTMVALFEMTDIFLVLLFVLLMYSITAVSAFKGNFNLRCRTTPAPINGTWEIDENIDRLCNGYGWGMYDCPTGTYCGSPDEFGIDIPSKDMTTKELTYYGAYGFDNVIRAFLANYMVITFEDWGPIMYRMADSNGAGFSQILFMTLGFIGAFFCINLIVAVIVNVFQAGRAKPEDDNNDNDDLQEIIENIDIDDVEKSFTPSRKHLKKAPTAVFQEGTPTNEAPKKKVTLVPRRGTSKNMVQSKIWIQDVCQKIKEFTYYKWIIVFFILLNHLLLALDRINESEKEEKIRDGFDVLIFAVFMLEGLIDIGSIGIMNYLEQKMLWIDALCNIFGIVEVALTYSNFTNGIFIDVLFNP